MMPEEHELAHETTNATEIPEDEDTVLGDTTMPAMEETTAENIELQSDEEPTDAAETEHPITGIYSLESTETEITEDERDMVTHVKDLLEYFAKRLDEPTPDKPEAVDLLLQCLRAQLDIVRQETDPRITEEALLETLEAILTEAGIEDAEHLARMYMQLYGIDELLDAHATTPTAAAVNQQIIEQCRKLARMALRLFAHHETPQLADS